MAYNNDIDGEKPTKRPAEDAYFEPEAEPERTKCRQCNKGCIFSVRFLKFAAIVLAVALATEGVLCLQSCVFDVRAYIISFYYVVFAVLVIISELKNTKVLLKYMSFLKYRAGRGVWFIFLGTISLGEEIWSILIAVSWILLGLTNFAVVCLGIDQKEDGIGNGSENKKSAKSPEPELSLSVTVPTDKTSAKAVDVEKEDDIGNVEIR